MKTILIVEDIEMNIDLLVQLLEDEYTLEIARDGEEAVNLANAHKPALILMDISLPKMDGYEATKAIRQTQPLLPIIGLSAHAMQGDAETAIASGFTDYLTKPIDDVMLLQRIVSLLGVSQ